MARPIWSGTVAFGIVSIPVQMFTAVREHDIHFHQLSRADRRRIHYKKVVEGSAEEVPASDIVKGFQVRPQEYVTFDAQELARLAARKTTSMEIESFAPLAEIDPRYFEQLYYLFPKSQAEKPYQLLHQALTDAHLVAVARLVMHGREHLVVLRSLPGVVAVQSLRFADEVVDPRTIAPAPKVRLSPQELELAHQLISSMASSFTIESYEDEYLKQLKAAIARKARGQTMEVPQEDDRADDEGGVVGLMEALQRSLAQRRPAAQAARAAARTAGQAEPARSHPPAGRASAPGGKRTAAGRPASSNAARAGAPSRKLSAAGHHARHARPVA